MSKYSVVQGLYLSFFSPSFYRDVAHNWGFRIITYLFIAVLIYVGIGATYQYQIFKHDVIHFANSIAELPPVSVKDGALETPNNKPFVLADEKQPSQPFLIIDPRDIKVATDKPLPAKILITKTQMIVEKNDGALTFYTIPAHFNTSFEPKLLGNYIISKADFLSTTFFISKFIILFFYRLSQAFILSILAFIVAAVLRIRLSYGQVFKVSIASLAPAIFANFLLPFTSAPVLISIAITLFYLVFGLAANKDEHIL